MPTAPGFLHGYQIFVGGWSRFNLDLAIAVAPSALIMWRLGEWIDFDDSDFYEGILVIAVFVGVVYAVGISLLLKTAGTILGIVATVVGIAVGVKRLWAKTSG